MSHAGIIIYNGLNLLLWQRGGDAGRKFCGKQ